MKKSGTPWFRARAGDHTAVAIYNVYYHIDATIISAE